MARPFLTNIDLTGNQILNALFQLLGSDPGSPAEGQFWYDSTNHVFKFRNNAATISVGRLDQISAPTADVSLNSHKLTNVTDGTAATDAATKGQLDAVQAGLDWKQSVRAATTVNGALATAYENGDTLDGVTLATGDRILLKDQTTGSENGIYTVNASGAPTRATDADVSAEVTTGLTVAVSEGTANADSVWTLTTNDPITLGTTALVFAKSFKSPILSSANPADVTTASPAPGSAGQASDAGHVHGIAADAVTYAKMQNVSAASKLLGRGSAGGSGDPEEITIGSGLSMSGTTISATGASIAKFSADVGDGAATSYNIDHNLGTLDVQVQVYRKSDGVEVVPDITRSTTNRVILAFAVAPTSAQYRVVVIG